MATHRTPEGGAVPPTDPVPPAGEPGTTQTDAPGAERDGTPPARPISRRDSLSASSVVIALARSSGS